MIPGSRRMKTVAAIGALALHAALASALMAPPDAQVAGGGVAAPAQLGTSFHDLVQGAALSAETPTETQVVPPPPPQAKAPTPNQSAHPTVTPSEPPAIEESPTTALPQSAGRPTTPSQSMRTTASLSQVPVAEESPTTKPIQSETPPFSRAARAPASAFAVQTEPDMAAPPTPKSSQPLSTETPAALAAAQKPSASAPSPSQALKSETPSAVHAPLAAVAARTPVAPDATASLTPNRSLVPPNRPKRIEQEAAARAAAAAKAKPKNPASAGNANRSATAGRPSATRSGPATSGGTTRSSQSPGNAAANNYPGLVFSCVSRAARLNRSPGRVARVAFRINVSGQVTNVSLTASSGDARLDRAAVRAIRRAGPCPRPPRGARTSFTIRVQ